MLLKSIRAKSVSRTSQVSIISIDKYTSSLSTLMLKSKVVYLMHQLQSVGKPHFCICVNEIFFKW